MDVLGRNRIGFLHHNQVKFLMYNINKLAGAAAAFGGQMMRSDGTGGGWAGWGRLEEAGKMPCKRLAPGTNQW